MWWIVYTFGLVVTVWVAGAVMGRGRNMWYDFCLACVLCVAWPVLWLMIGCILVIDNVDEQSYRDDVMFWRNCK